MARAAHAITLLAMSLLLTGCGARYAQVDNAAAFPYRYANFDYHLAWRTTQLPEGLAIEGTLKNVRYAVIESLQLTVSLLGRDGALRAKETEIPIPQHSRQDEIVPFSIILKKGAPEKGDILEFAIQYRASEGGKENGLLWLTTVEVDAATGAPVGR
ncbi:hypothetical protein [Geobacter sp. DSM 9736]|uniref:hypothetical protein n=1 Tax=Geobacter sp. DSM 9736 TaxID=1277350 RepID=UPI000B508560|nr:hypothetical protein [Geobacter sp. DSM 9736]SNB45211.1 hypothetical protein SAMN06269301_0614 [Geobacter sp. DSM 9736]